MLRYPDFPAGGIIMWAGALADIPGGWALCDGTNGTPNLKNRFIVGAGDAYAKGDTGGSADAVVVAHSHTGSTNTTGNHRHSDTFYNQSNGSVTGPQFMTGRSWPKTFYSDYAGNHSHSLNINSTGEDGTGKNLPPYYALAYIMKL